MNNFAKKHAAGIIGWILVAAIIIVAVLTVTPADTDPPALGQDDIEDTTDSTPLPENPDEGSNDDIKVTYDPFLPKPAVASEEYLYTQSLCGVGNVKLKEVLPTSNKIYIVAETDCVIGDISGNKPTVGIALCDSLGNVEKTFSLPASAETKYLSSALTAEGIVVVTTAKNGSYVYVNVVDYELTTIKTGLISSSDKVSVYPAGENFVIFAETAEECLIYKYDGKNFTFRSLTSSEVVDVFDYGEYYKIFYNTADGYSYCELNKNTLDIKKSLSVSKATLIDIIPMIENNSQVFLCLEQEDSVYLKKYSSDFNASTAVRKNIGNVEILGQGYDGAILYLAVRGSINGIITVDVSLTTSFMASDTAFLEGNISDYVFYDGKFRMLISDGEKLALVTLSENTSDARYFNLSSSVNRLAAYSNGTMSLITESSFHHFSAVGIIGLNP